MKSDTLKSVYYTLLSLVLVPLFVLLVYLVQVTRSIPPLLIKVDNTLSDAQSALVSVHDIEMNTTRTESEMAGLLNTTRHIAVAEEKAQEKQLQTVQELSTKAYALLDDADQTVKSVGEIPPTVAEAIKETSEDLHTSLYSSQRMLEAATDDLSSPSIKTSMENLQDATKSTASATQNVADATKDIKEYVHRETTPVRGFWNGVKALINLTWSIRGAAGI